MPYCNRAHEPNIRTLASAGTKTAAVHKMSDMTAELKAVHADNVELQVRGL